MTSRRKALLPILLLFVAFLFLGGIGTVELTVWLVLLAVWIWAFVAWGRADVTEPKPQPH
jgi:hypothetical protein